MVEFKYMLNNYKKVLLSFVAICAFIFPGCVNKDHSKKDASKHLSQLQVVTTTGMLADAVRHLGGEYVHVKSIMGPGIDPHLYKPSPEDIMSLTKADLVVFNGLHLEGKMGEILEKLVDKGTAYNYSQGIKGFSGLLVEDGAVDPHIWMDVQLWSQGLDALSKKLEDLSKVVLADNLEKYKLNLADLHAWCIKEVSKIPQQSRVLITAHDAFSYFGKAYHVEVQGIQGLSTESEAGLNEINALVDLIVKKGVKAVFVESSVPVRNVQALIEGARHRGSTIKVGGELYSDAMGDEGTPEGTFIGMIKHNINTIVGALK